MQKNLSNPHIRMMTRGVLIFLLFLIHGCRKNEDSISDQSLNVVNLWKLERIGTKIFKLDSATNPGISSFQYIPLENDSGEFVFLNNGENALLFYDFKSAKLTKKLYLDDEGPNATPGITGFTVLENDSIALYSKDSWQFYFIDSKGERFLDFSGEPNLLKLKYPPYSQVDGNRLLTKHKEFLFSIGFIYMEFDDDNEKNRMVGSLFDFNKNEIKSEYIIPYPDLYQKGNWYGNFFRNPYYCKNGNLIVVSFPASPNLSVYDLENKSLKEYTAGSINLSKVNAAIEEFQDTDKTRSMYHFIENDRYGAVLYDPYRDCYYRFASKGAINADVTDKKTLLTDLYIIILDSDFNYKGEQKLSGIEYGVGGISFVTPDGIAIANIAYPNDDQLTFDIFNLVK